MLTLLIQERLRLLMEHLGYDSPEGMPADCMEVLDSRIEEFQAEYGPKAKAGERGEW